VIVNNKLLGTFRANHVPVTGFVIQRRVESLGAAGRLILELSTQANGRERPLIQVSTLSA